MFESSLRLTTRLSIDRTFFAVTVTGRTYLDAMTLRPVDWNVFHPLDRQPLAITRLIYLGARRERCFRAVPASADRARRALIGY